VFDPAFLSELEVLVAESGVAAQAAPTDSASLPGFQQALDAFLAPHGDGSQPLGEEGFVALPQGVLVERTNGLIEACRGSARRGAAQAVESFVVFFQTLVPTLRERAAREVKATFFRLAPTLVHVALDDFGQRDDRREEGRLALQQLESLLLEVASVRLAPAESALLFKSLDQLATLIAAGEYALARDVVSTPLVSLLRKNRLARSLFRLMEAEVGIQRYLQERLGQPVPRIQVPDHLAALTDFGPVHVFEEDGADGRSRRFLQLELPDIPMLSDVVVHLVDEGSGDVRRLRLDGLGSAELEVPAGLYRLGLTYEPEGGAGG
jgi:hypothetical protein